MLICDTIGLLCLSVSIGCVARDGIIILGLLRTVETYFHIVLSAMFTSLSVEYERVLFITALIVQVIITLKVFFQFDRKYLSITLIHNSLITSVVPHVF